MYGAERKGETKENETEVREGTDRRLIIVKQGKARKGKLSETRRSAERYGEVRKSMMCGKGWKSAEMTLGKIIVKVKCHVMKSRGVTVRNNFVYITVFLGLVSVYIPFAMTHLHFSYPLCFLYR